VVLTLRIGTVGPAKTDTAADVSRMPPKELFEAAWNDEPILSDEVSILGNSVKVARPSRLLRRGLRFPHGWFRFHKGERGRTARSGAGKMGADCGCDVRFELKGVRCGLPTILPEREPRLLDECLALFSIVENDEEVMGAASSRRFTGPWLFECMKFKGPYSLPKNPPVAFCSLTFSLTRVL
jgi:hypothetical protein